MLQEERNRFSKELLEQWRERMIRWESSDQTLESFCRAEGISKSTFYRKRVQLQEKKSQAKEQAPAKKSTSFIDLGLLKSGEEGSLSSTVQEIPSGHDYEVRLELGNGVVFTLRRS